MTFLKTPGAFIISSLIALLACGMVFVRTSTSAPIGPTGAVFVLNPSNSADPCLAWTSAKSTVAVNVTVATTELVAAVSGKVIHVCGFSSTNLVNSTAIFKTGQKVSTACDTAPVNLTGTFNLAAVGIFNLHSSGELFKSATSGEVCLTSAGGFQGVMEYTVQ